jgi:hypothetical protein
MDDDPRLHGKKIQGYPVFGGNQASKRSSEDTASETSLSLLKRGGESKEH